MIREQCSVCVGPLCQHGQAGDIRQCASPTEFAFRRDAKRLAEFCQLSCVRRNAQGLGVGHRQKFRVEKMQRIRIQHCRFSAFQNLGQPFTSRVVAA